MNKTVKIIKNTNSPIINYISSKINRSMKSYAPSINLNLVTIKSGINKTLRGCNSKRALQLKEILKIPTPDKKCIAYNSEKGIQIMLNRLKHHKHINIKNLVPPRQEDGNCWFNTMFMTFFVSDKGRKFFHFFRQLMIVGKLYNGTAMPKNLKEAFALFNYAIDSAISGGPGAYMTDTNYIISEIYENIPKNVRGNFIPDVGDAGNPLYYYKTIIQYLNSSEIKMINISMHNSDWKTVLNNYVIPNQKMPHIITVEISDNESMVINNKPKKFKIQEATYVLDSIIIRDTSKMHFSAVLTCGGKDYAYDGMSFHKLVQLNWKNQINTTNIWEYEGSDDIDGNLLKWNFMQGYQILMYYRIK
jgi:hypothetical protein